MYYKNSNECKEELITLEEILKDIIAINNGETDQPTDCAMDHLELKVASILKSICHAMYELETTSYRFRSWEAVEYMLDVIRNFEPHNRD